MADSWLATNGWGTADSLVAAGILAVGAFCLHSADRIVSNWFRIPAAYKAYAAVALCFFGLYFFPGQENWLYRAIAYLIGVGFLCFVLRATLRGYDDVGFGAAFYSTQKGVEFEKSLQLAERSLDFLGIGADKLSSTPSFAPAMERCASGGRTVRLLLWRPEGHLLEILAKRNEADPAQYARNVKASLGRIAKIKFSKDLDIQVKFYPVSKDKDLRFFRLMFLDEQICLWSWTDWGKHVGRDNPQVVLMNRAKEGAKRSAYQAFQDYFNRLWEDDSVVVANLEDYREAH